MAGWIYKELWHNKKVRGWTDTQVRLWLMCISYTEDHDSKGFLDEADMTVVLTTQGISPSVVDELVQVRGLDRAGTRYRVHNYGERKNLSRKRAEAGKKGYTAMVASLSGKTAGQTLETFSPANNGVEVGVVKELFEFWKGVTGKTRAVLDAKRRRVFAHALTLAPVDDVRDALQGWQNDPWAERRLHLEPKYLIGDAAAIEKFRDFWRNGKPAAPSQSQAVKNAMTLMGRTA